MKFLPTDIVVWRNIIAEWAIVESMLDCHEEYNEVRLANEEEMKIYREQE